MIEREAQPVPFSNILQHLCFICAEQVMVVILVLMNPADFLYLLEKAAVADSKRSLSPPSVSSWQSLCIKVIKSVFLLMEISLIQLYICAVVSGTGGLIIAKWKLICFARCAASEKMSLLSIRSVFFHKAGTLFNARTVRSGRFTCGIKWIKFIRLWFVASSYGCVTFPGVCT